MKSKNPSGALGNHWRDMLKTMRRVAVVSLGMGCLLTGTGAQGATDSTSGLHPGVDRVTPQPAAFTVWRSATGYFYSRTLAGATTATQWGASTDVPVEGDFDGDGKKDIAVWRPSTGYWYIIQSSNGQVVTHQWGAPTDIPVVGDFDGDGKADIAVWRPSTGYWYILQSSNGQVVSQQFGAPTDEPVIGDFDGDGKTDLAVWRASTGYWYIFQSTTKSAVAKQFGAPTDQPVAGDFDGDGKTDIAVWRSSTGYWYIEQSSNGAVVAKQFGASTDIPVPQDYDGDGKTDLAVWRPSTGYWYVIESGSDTTIATAWGASTDKPANDSFEPEALLSSVTPSVSVPNVVDDTQAAATTAIDNAGLTVGTVTQASSSTVATGYVISESPAAGTSVAPGSAVALVVSTGAGSSGGGGTTTTGFWLPYTATPTASDGKSGLFLVPSSNITAAPSFVTSASTTLVAVAAALTTSGNRISSESLALLVYRAPGSDGKIHLYGLNLTSTTVPVPVQIGTFAITNDNQFCDSGDAETNLTQPTSMFLLVHYNPTSTADNNKCNLGGDVYEVINYTDSPTTAPVVVSVNSTDINALYHSTGALAGLVMVQGSNLDFFASKAFTSPTVLVSNVGTADDVADTTTAGQDLVGDSVSFYSVTTTTNSQAAQLYRITTAGTATSIYTGTSSAYLTGADSTGDANNIFFSDETADGTGFKILAAPINSGNAVLLYTEDSTTGSYELVGSNGSQLAYVENSNAGNVIVKTLSATAPSSPASIATFTGAASAFTTLAEATPGTLSSSQILVNLYDSTYTTRSSAALTFSGTFTQAQLANSEFQEDLDGYSGSTIQLRGVSGANDGGGSINLYTISSGSVVPFTLSGGGAYKIPTGAIAYVFPFGNSASDTIGEGLVSAGDVSSGLATDSATHVIAPVGFADTSVNVY